MSEGQKELGDISPSAAVVAMVMTAGMTAVCHMDADWLLVQIEELWLLSGGGKCCANCKDILRKDKDKAGVNSAESETRDVSRNEQ